MTLIPVVAARRAGIRLAPRWRVDDDLGASLRDAMWASLVIVPAQLFLLGSLVVAGRVAGGVVACQIAFTVFLLPHALLGHPLATVLYPRVAQAWTDGRHAAVTADARRGLRTLLLLTAPAGALLVALSTPAMQVLAVGALTQDAGAVAVAAALAGYGIGLAAYSWSLFLTRVSYATGDVRTPGIAALMAGAVGAALLVTAAQREGTALLFRVGIAHSAMVTAAAVAVLVVLVRRRLVAATVGSWAGVAVAAGAAGVTARVVTDRLDLGTGRGGSVASVVVGSAAALAVYLGVVFAFGIRWRDVRAELA
jgi:putative peptidoglycan lipid II flippase